MDDSNLRSFGDMRINVLDIGDTIAQRRLRAGNYTSSTAPLIERRSPISPLSNMSSSSYQVTRMRNLSGGSSGSISSGSSNASSNSTQSDNQYCSTDNNNNLYFPLDITSNSPFANTSDVPSQHNDDLTHRKLDRSLSDTDSERSQRSVNSSRYKTELCRPFEESGSCKYGDKCQFAHGAHELRNLSRHPKYKTEPCRTFHTTGFCPYGPRCHFVHEDDKGDGSSKSSSGSSSPSVSPTGNEHNNFSYSSYSNNRNMDNTQIDKSLTINTYYGTSDLEQRFNSTVNLNYKDDSSRTFNTNSSPNDIFSSISVFSVEEHKTRQEQVDNAPKSSNHSLYSSSSSSSPQALDNYSYQGLGSIPNFWSNVPSQGMAPVDRFHHSPTGSTGSTSSSSVSDSGCSDCSMSAISSRASSTSSGSTESLTGYNVQWNHHQPRSFQYVC